MELQSKAWVINEFCFKSHYEAPDKVFYAESAGKAKSDALHYVHGDYFDRNDEEFTFATLRVKRAPNSDRFLVDGIVKTKYRIEEDQKRADRDKEFDQLLDDNPDGYAYIMKGGYYYRSNYGGYTEYSAYAGVYSLEDAVKHCKGSSLSDYRRPILIDIEKHNSMINEKIADLKIKLITV